MIVRPLTHSSSGLPNSSALQTTGELSASSSESPDKCWSKELDQQFQSALKQKLSRSDSTWISATSLVQWLQGTNRTRPCRLLSSLDTKALLAGLGQKQGFSLFLQSYPFLECIECSANRNNGDTTSRRPFPRRNPSPETNGPPSP